MFRRGEDRRQEFRRPADRPVIVLAQGIEIGGRVTDESKGGVRLRLDRTLATGRVIVIEVREALAVEIDLTWVDGRQAGGRRVSETRLGGLVPARLTAARAVWMRAGGR